MYWLNERRRTADHARVERLLKNLAIIRRWAGEGTDNTDGIYWDAAGMIAVASSADTKRAFASARRELRRHRFWPELANVANPDAKARGSKLDFCWCPVKRSGDGASWAASWAMLTIHLLGTRGLLYRIQRCKKCSRWFFARTLQQTSCSEKCRKQLYKSSPQFKEHRRKYMRWYRAHSV